MGRWNKNIFYIMNLNAHTDFSFCKLNAHQTEQLDNMQFLSCDESKQVFNFECLLNAFDQKKQGK